MFAQVAKTERRGADSQRIHSHFVNESSPPLQSVDDSRDPVLLSRKSSCACGGGCPACQANSGSLKISQPNDSAEIEADAIANKIMRIAAGDTKSPASTVGHANTIRRMSDAHEKEIQPKALPSAGQNFLQSPTHVQNAISSGGRPLDKATRNFFEPRLGYDLSGVRIHTDSTAGQSARAINAKAYTFGNNIVFASGEYEPESESGKHLIAHELAHTTQQASNAIRRSPADGEESDAICEPPVPHGEQRYGGPPPPVGTDPAKRDLFLGERPDPTIISGFAATGLREFPDLKTALNVDLTRLEWQSPGSWCNTRGARYQIPENDLGIAAVEFCQKGEFVYFKFACKGKVPNADQSGECSFECRPPAEVPTSNHASYAAAVVSIKGPGKCGFDEYRITTPEGTVCQVDGIDAKGQTWEVKTGLTYLNELTLAAKLQFSDRIQDAIANVSEQRDRCVEVTSRCNVPYLWAVTSPEVAQYLNQQWEGKPPVRCIDLMGRTCPGLNGLDPP